MIPDQQSQQTSKGSILIVDDEPLIAMLVDDAFRDVGYPTLLAGSGAQALEILGAKASDIQGLITDIRLPDDIDGWMIAKHARKVSPGLPVLYFTGDVVPDQVIDGVPGSKFMVKPVPVEELVAAMVELLGPDQTIGRSMDCGPTRFN